MHPTSVQYATDIRGSIAQMLRAILLSEVIGSLYQGTLQTRQRSAAKRGWLTTTTTGTSSRARGDPRWDVTLTNGDGTEVDHKQDIDEPNKETKALWAIGGSEDGGREQG